MQAEIKETDIKMAKLKQPVIFEELGMREYKATWEYQELLFNSLLAMKKGTSKGEEEKAYASNRLLFVEHPHVYTLGKSGSENNLLLDYIQLQAREASFFRIDRGGDITYHGPGQIVGYPIFDLERFRISLKDYIHRLEEAVIMTISEFGLEGSRLGGATGVWLDAGSSDRASKICAIGVKASRYITMHGFAFNVNTKLEYFNYINPCGFTDKGVTSLEKELGSIQDFGRVKEILKSKLEEVFQIEWINKNE